jgi:hypothetical protein
MKQSGRVLFPPATSTTKAKTMKAIIFILGLICISFASYAQTFTGAPSFSPDVLDNPIDGGLSLLLGAGAAYGAKKLKDHRNNTKRNKELDE